MDEIRRSDSRDKKGERLERRTSFDFAANNLPRNGRPERINGLNETFETNFRQYEELAGGTSDMLLKGQKVICHLWIDHIKSIFDDAKANATKHVLPFKTSINKDKRDICENIAKKAVEDFKQMIQIMQAEVGVEPSGSSLSRQEAGGKGKEVTPPDEIPLLAGQLSFYRNSNIADRQRMDELGNSARNLMTEIRRALEHYSKKDNKTIKTFFTQQIEECLRAYSNIDDFSIKLEVLKTFAIQRLNIKEPSEPSIETGESDISRQGLEEHSERLEEKKHMQEEIDKQHKLYTEYKESLEEYYEKYGRLKYDTRLEEYIEGIEHETGQSLRDTTFIHEEGIKYKELLLLIKGDIQNFDRIPEEQVKYARNTIIGSRMNKYTRFVQVLGILANNLDYRNPPSE